MLLCALVGMFLATPEPPPVGIVVAALLGIALWLVRRLLHRRQACRPVL